jgi:hypothetical protein
MQALLLIVATTVLTCSSLFGFYFLKLFLMVAVSGEPLGTRLRIRYAVLALLAFGVSFGSGWLLSYTLSRV